METNIFKDVLPNLITEKNNGFFMIEELKSINKAIDGCL